MTKAPLTHQNLAGSTNPARIWLLSLQSTPPPSSWLRVTRCPDMFLLQQFISCVFPQWLLYCSISSGLPGSPQEMRRCRISSGAAHQAVQSCPQQSFAADSSRLQSWESCTWVQAGTEHTGLAIWPTWLQMDVQVLIHFGTAQKRVGGQLEASQTRWEVLILTHSTLLVSRAQIPVFIPAGNCTVGVQGISVRIELGLLRVLCQQALTVIASVGDRKHAVNFCGFPETRSFLLAFCPPPWYWVIVTSLEQIPSLQVGVSTVAWRSGLDNFICTLGSSNIHGEVLPCLTVNLN